MGLERLRHNVADRAPDAIYGLADLSSVRECAAMVDLLNQQISELDRLNELLKKRRDRWAEHLDAFRSGEHSAAKQRRASRGSLHNAVVQALARATSGMTIDQLDRAISRQLTTYSRNSIYATLARLRDACLVVHEGPIWRLA